MEIFDSKVHPPTDEKLPSSTLVRLFEGSVSSGQVETRSRDNTFKDQQNHPYARYPMFQSVEWCCCRQDSEGKGRVLGMDEHHGYCCFDRKRKQIHPASGMWSSENLIDRRFLQLGYSSYSTQRESTVDHLRLQYQ